MKDDGSKNIVDFYMKANENKEKIVNNVTGHRSFSEAELTVLSCLMVLAREAEMSKLEYLDKEMDYNETIKIILIKSLGSSIDSLKNKEKYESIIRDYDNIEPYTYPARVAYNSLSDNIYPFYNPVYPEEKFINQYLDLHDIIRQGHIYWGAKGERLESILEHIYGCCILALGIDSEYGYSIDFDKLIRMLLLHETGEILIGDLTEWDVSKDRKKEIERNAVIEVCSSLENGKEFISLFDEFNENETLVARYANLIDKLEYDMQVKAYELEGRYDYDNIPSNVVTNSDSVKNIMMNGAQSVFDVHYEYDKDRYSSIPCTRRILEQTKKLS